MLFCRNEKAHTATLCCSVAMRKLTLLLYAVLTLLPAHCTVTINLELLYVRCTMTLRQLPPLSMLYIVIFTANLNAKTKALPILFRALLAGIVFEAVVFN
jgi:hypothetical protein